MAYLTFWHEDFAARLLDIFTWRMYVCWVRTWLIGEMALGDFSFLLRICTLLDFVYIHAECSLQSTEYLLCLDIWQDPQFQLN